jgi:sarcosine oxidase
VKIAVIGAGVFGAAAAVELIECGHQVTLFDMDLVPAPRASSTDECKAIRRVYYAQDKAGYVDLVESSARQWHVWEQVTGRHVLHRAGHLSILSSFAHDSLMADSVRLLHDRGATEVEMLSARMLRQRFPQFSVADDEIGVYDPWGGYLESTSAVRLLIDIARDAGVELRERTRVTGLDENPAEVVIYTGDLSRSFDQAVVAAGAWIGRLLPAIARRLFTTRQELLLLPTPNVEAFTYPRMPVWSADPDGDQWYGFPLLREGRVKVARDRLGPEVDADIDRTGTSAFAEDVVTMLKQRIPGLAEFKESYGRSCLYTMAPDAHFIIDRVPGFERLIVAGAGSGHGFKFGGVIGQLIASVVEDRVNTNNEMFQIGDRFHL